MPPRRPGKRSLSHGKTRTSRAGLQFPVARVHRLLQEGKYGKRIGGGAPVYLTAVMEYMAAEILRQAGKATKAEKKKHIRPLYLQVAIGKNKDLNKLLGGMITTEGELLPNILPKTDDTQDAAAAAKPTTSKGKITKMAKRLPKPAPPSVPTQ